MSDRLAYPSLRAYLEAHIEEAWIMRGGDFAGQVRTARGLLEESQDVAMMTQGGASIKMDSLDLPVFEVRGVVYFPEGTRIFGFTLPFDAPLMAKEFRP